MFKWVLCLCVTIYATLLLFGGDGYRPEEQAEVLETTAPQNVQAARIEPTGPEAADIAAISPEPNVEPVPDIAAAPTADFAAAPAIEVTRTDTTSVATSALVAVATPEPSAPVVTPEPVQTASVAELPSTNEVWRVTGDRVNLRAGPSTSDEIVGRALRGDSAEIIELLPNGWAKVFLVEAGLEAYMSAQFVAAQS